MECDDIFDEPFGDVPDPTTTFTEEELEQIRAKERAWHDHTLAARRAVKEYLQRVSVMLAEAIDFLDESEEACESSDS